MGVAETNGSRRYQSTFESKDEAEQYAQKRRAEISEAAFNGQMGRRPKRSGGAARWIDEYDTASQASNIRQVAMWFAETH